MLDILLPQLVNGLVLGTIYVLIAIGLSIVFGLLGIINFAHGVFFALGAYVALSLQRTWGWPAVIFAPLVVGGVGIVVEMTLIRRLYGKDPLFSLIMTFALALLVEAIIRSIWGSAGQPFTPPPFLSGFVEYGPVLVTKYRLAILAATAAILVALWLFLQFTPLGRILRAGSRDPEMVGLLGINLRVVFTFVFGLGTALAGAAGVLAGPLWSVTPSMSHSAIMPAFVTITIGGLGSYLGAVIAGLLVGVVTALTVQFWPEASSSAMYVLMIVILLVRPRGLLGERWERFE